jgi:hypothetical protein
MFINSDDVSTSQHVIGTRHHNLQRIKRSDVQRAQLARCRVRYTRHTCYIRNYVCSRLWLAGYDVTSAPLFNQRPLMPICTPDRASSVELPSDVEASERARNKSRPIIIKYLWVKMWTEEQCKQATFSMILKLYPKSLRRSQRKQRDPTGLASTDMTSHEKKELLRLIVLCWAEYHVSSLTYVSLSLSIPLMCTQKMAPFNLNVHRTRYMGSAKK